MNRPRGEAAGRTRGIHWTLIIALGFPGSRRSVAPTVIYRSSYLPLSFMHFCQLQPIQRGLRYRRRHYYRRHRRRGLT